MVSVEEWWRYHRLMTEPLRIVHARPHEELEDHVRFFLSRPVSDLEKDRLTNLGVSFDPRFFGRVDTDEMVVPMSVAQFRVDPMDLEKSFERAKSELVASLRRVNEEMGARVASEKAEESKARQRDALNKLCAKANAEGWPAA